jgi:hypothetical protein
METILLVLVSLAIVTASVVSLLWIARKLFGVLPASFNSTKTNAILLSLLVCTGIAYFWLHSLDQMLEAPKWSLTFCQNLAWVIVLPGFFLATLRGILTSKTTESTQSISSEAPQSTPDK